jgi:hypothetical protein
LYCAAGPWGRRFRSSWLSCTGWWFGAFGFVLYYWVPAEINQDFFPETPKPPNPKIF